MWLLIHNEMRVGEMIHLTHFVLLLGRPSSGLKVYQDVLVDTP